MVRHKLVDISADDVLRPVAADGDAAGSSGEEDDDPLTPGAGFRRQRFRRRPWVTRLFHPCAGFGDSAAPPRTASKAAAKTAAGDEGHSTEGAGQPPPPAELMEEEDAVARLLPRLSIVDYFLACVCCHCVQAMAKSDVDGTDCCYNMCCWHGLATYAFVRRAYGLMGNPTADVTCAAAFCCVPCMIRRLRTEVDYQCQLQPTKEQAERELLRQQRSALGWMQTDHAQQERRQNLLALPRMYQPLKVTGGGSIDRKMQAVAVAVDPAGLTCALYRPAGRMFAIKPVMSRGQLDILQAMKNAQLSGLRRDASAADRVDPAHLRSSSRGRSSSQKRKQPLAATANAGGANRRVEPAGALASPSSAVGDAWQTTDRGPWSTTLLGCDHVRDVVQATLFPCCVSHTVRHYLYPLAAEERCFDWCCVLPCAMPGQVRRTFYIEPVSDERFCCGPCATDVVFPCVCYPCWLDRARRECLLRMETSEYAVARGAAAFPLR